MRRTTIIILAVLAAFLLFTIGFLIYASTVDPKENYIQHEIKQEWTFLETQPYKTTFIETINPEDYRLALYLEGGIAYKTDTLNRNKIGIPKELSSNIETKVLNDTLFIKIKTEQLLALLPDAESRKEVEKGRFGKITGATILLPADSTIRISNQDRFFSLNFDGLSLSQLTINTRGSITIDHCRITETTVENSNGKLDIKNSDLITFNLDLDSINRWDVTNSRIQTANFTGSNHRLIADPQEFCQTLNWLPKKEGARLQLELKDKATKVTF